MEESHARSEMAQALIEHGAHPDARDAAGRTAVWLATHAQQPLLLRRLLELRASPSIADSSGVQHAVVMYVGGSGSGGS